MALRNHQTGIFVADFNSLHPTLDSPENSVIDYGNLRNLNMRRVRQSVYPTIVCISVTMNPTPRLTFTNFAKETTRRNRRTNGGTLFTCRPSLALE